MAGLCEDRTKGVISNGREKSSLLTILLCILILVSDYKYYVYITTNFNKSTLYIGVTNNLARRLQEHYDSRDDESSFAGKYHCYNLVYCEIYENILDAINREKEIKKWRRNKKNKLIEEQNPNWKFMNDHIL